MLKRFCDICEREIPPKDSGDGNAFGRTTATLRANNCQLTVEVITSKNGVANSGDFCKYCILDALYKLDDRPEQVKDKSTTG